jgi:hypothetical protein
MNKIISCIGDSCKKMRDASIRFVNSVDVNIQKRIEDDINQGVLIEQNIRILASKQEEVRNLIESYVTDMSVSNIRTLLAENKNLSDMIKNVFTYYYTDVLDRIPSERKQNMTDTADDIRNLDMSIQVMYCIELMCNPDDYVMNYQLDSTYTEEELEEEMKKCSITDATEYAPKYRFQGKRDPYTGVTMYSQDPTMGLRRRMNATMQTTMNRGGKKTRKNKKAKPGKKAKKSKKTRVKKSNKTKKAKAKTNKGKKNRTKK